MKIFARLFLTLLSFGFVATSHANLSLPFVIQGTLSGASNQESGRLYRNGIQSTVLAPKSSCPSVVGGTTNYSYDVYTFTNTAATPVGLSVDYTSMGSANVLAAAYIGNFDPTNICTNYAADSGFSSSGTLQSFSFVVPAGATYSVVVQEVTPGTGGTYRLKVLHGLGTGAFYSNTAAITINDNTNASPYPSQINISGNTGAMTHMAININGFSHTFPSDVGIMVAYPGNVLGATVMTDVGGGANAVNLNLHFDDLAPNAIVGALASGIFKPILGTPGDTWGAPAPAGPYPANFSSQFNGFGFNGLWNLYVKDDTLGDTGSIANGWSMELHQNIAPTLSVPATAELVEGDVGRSIPLGVAADTEWAPEELSTPAFATAPLTVTNVQNVAGNLSGLASIPCGTAGTHPSLQVWAQDQFFGIGKSITVNVAPNTPPTLGSYSAASAVTYGGGISVVPTAPPVDNGSISLLSANAESGFTGTVSIDPASGTVTIGNAAPLGNHTVTITALDNCGLTSATTFNFQVTAVPPAITSPTMAGATVGAPFEYVLTATGTAPISYAVTSGALPAGLSLSGNTISGFPTTIGKSSVSITASNPGGSAVLNLVIDVGAIGDVDGDGFPDELETALGSDPNSYDSTPTGSPAGVPQALSISKMSVKLNFAKGNADGLMITGTLPIPAGFNLNGQKVAIDVGGVVKTFTLNAKGLSAKGNDMFGIHVLAKKGVVPAQSAKFAVKFSNDSLASALASSGLSNANKTGPVSVRVIALFDGQLFLQNKSLQYTAKAGKTGSAK